MLNKRDDILAKAFGWNNPTDAQEEWDRIQAEMEKDPLGTLQKQIEKLGKPMTVTRVDPDGEETIVIDYNPLDDGPTQ